MPSSKNILIDIMVISSIITSNIEKSITFQRNLNTPLAVYDDQILRPTRFFGITFFTLSFSPFHPFLSLFLCLNFQSNSMGWSMKTPHSTFSLKSVGYLSLNFQMLLDFLHSKDKTFVLSFGSHSCFLEAKILLEMAVL